MELDVSNMLGSTGPTLYVPLRPRLDGTMDVLAKQMESGHLALPVWSRLEELARSMGEETVFAEMNEGQVNDLFRESGADFILLDADFTVDYDMIREVYGE